MTFGVAHMAQVIRIPEGGRLPFETDGVSPGRLDRAEVLAEIQSEMAVTRESLEATTAGIIPGTDAVQEAWAEMEAVAERIQHCASSIQAVSDVIEDQAATAEETNRLMDELDSQACSVAADAPESTDRMDQQLERVRMTADSVGRLVE